MEMKYVAHPAEVDQMVLNILILIKKYIYYQQNKSKITKKKIIAKKLRSKNIPIDPSFQEKVMGHIERRD